MLSTSQHFVSNHDHAIEEITPINELVAFI